MLALDASLASLPCPTSAPARPRLQAQPHQRCLPCASANSNKSLHRDALCLDCLLRDGAPFFLGRFGLGTETKAACLASVHYRYHSEARLDAFFDSKFLRDLQMHAGIKTVNVTDAYLYGLCYAAAVNASDVIVRFGSHMEASGLPIPLRKPFHTCSKYSSYQKADALVAASGHHPGALVHFRVLDPWLAPSPVGSDDDALVWIRALRGKTVLIVHPFDQTIRSQLDKGGPALWLDIAERVMPSTIKWKVVRSPQYIGYGLPHDPSFKRSWREALSQLIQDVDAAGHFDVAVMACGGYGMLLGAHLRATGRSSIYLGGSLQECCTIAGNTQKQVACATRWCPANARQVSSQSQLEEAQHV